VQDISGGFRLYRRTVFDEFEVTSRHFDVQAEIVIKAYARGFRLREVPFHYRPRETGMTKARIWAYGWAFLRTGLRLWRLRNTVYFADYDHRAYTSRIPLQRLWHWRRYRLITSMLEGHEPALDVGCGSWRFILTSDAVGVDNDIAKARYVNQRRGRIVCADASRLPFRNEVFREVVCTEVIEHLPEGEDVFPELARVLQHGGNLVITTPDYSSVVWRTLEWIYERLLPGAYAVQHVTRYDRTRLVESLNRSGFRVNRVGCMFHSVIAVTATRATRHREDER
jgi:SAM-dependent methyltransferase